MASVGPTGVGKTTTIAKVAGVNVLTTRQRVREDGEAAPPERIVDLFGMVFGGNRTWIEPVQCTP